METGKVVVRNREGLHARAAARLVTLCSRLRSRVVLLCNGRAADGRHLIALITLSAAMGAQLTIEASGPDEKHAVSAVMQLISSGFDER